MIFTIPGLPIFIAGQPLPWRRRPIDRRTFEVFGAQCFPFSVMAAKVARPGGIRAGVEAIPAPYALVVIHHNNAVRPFPCRVYRTDRNA